MRHNLDTEIDINAAPEAVWDILTDLDHYADWNPFIVSGHGKVDVGERLTNRMQPPEGKPMTFKPSVTVAEPNQVFEWLGHLGLPGIFDGRHRFELEPTASGTRLVQSEQFSGVLVRFMRNSLDTQTHAGFIAMNEALKARAEGSAQEQS